MYLVCISRFFVPKKRYQHICRYLRLSKKIFGLYKLYKKHGGVALSKTFHRNVLEF